MAAVSHPLFAGIGGHHRSKSRTDVWLTPREILDALGEFDLDPSAADVRPWPTARAHYTEADNGLLLPWFGRVWLNPPYSTILLRKFMARMAAHGRGTALIFARTETETFHRYVWESASALLFLEGRINFLRPNGVPALRPDGKPQNAGGPSVLCAYGMEDADVLAGSGLDGAFVPLRLPRVMVIAALEPTWLQAVDMYLRARSGPVALSDLYRAFAAHPKAKRNPNYQAKIRQVLQQGPFRRLKRGEWAAA